MNDSDPEPIPGRDDGQFSIGQPHNLLTELAGKIGEAGHEIVKAYPGADFVVIVRQKIERGEISCGMSSTLQDVREIIDTLLQSIEAVAGPELAQLIRARVSDASRPKSDR